MSNVNLLERSALGKAWNAKLACAITLVLIFSCGAVVGALAMDFGVHSRTRTLAFDSPQGRAAYFDRLQKELDLTPAQSEQIKSILNDFWQYYRSVLTESKARVEQLLNEEQRQKFEKILQQQTLR
jgi:hypothetical protein